MPKLTDDPEFFERRETDSSFFGRLFGQAFQAGDMMLRVLISQDTFAPGETVAAKIVVVVAGKPLPARRILARLRGCERAIYPEDGPDGTTFQRCVVEPFFEEIIVVRGHARLRAKRSFVHACAQVLHLSRREKPSG